MITQFFLWLNFQKKIKKGIDSAFIRAYHGIVIKLCNKVT